MDIGEGVERAAWLEGRETEAVESRYEKSTAAVILRDHFLHVGVSAFQGFERGILCGGRRRHDGVLVNAHESLNDVGRSAGVALKSGNSYVEEMVAEYDRRRRLLVAGLNRLGLSTFEPRGAFYTFPNIQASGMDDETFAEKLLREEHVAVVPGNAFGPGGDGFVRACYATEYSKIEEALHRMEKFMNRYG